MHISWSLVAWIFRPLFWPTLISSIVVMGYVLFHDEPLDFRHGTYALPFVIVHSFLISRLLGRVRSESFAFLYSQGFSRRRLWLHLWLASWISVLAVWLPSALLIFTSLRSQLQDAIENPWFPMMTSFEWSFPAWTLFAYALFLPLFHYEWMRSSTPFRGLVSGHLLAIGYFVFGLLVFEPVMSLQPYPARNLVLSGFAAISTVLGLFGGWLHQRLEVHS